MKPPANKATFPIDTAASPWRATLSWAVDQVHVPCTQTALNVQLIAINEKIMGNSLRVSGDSHEALAANDTAGRKGLGEKAGIIHKLIIGTSTLRGLGLPPV